MTIQELIQNGGPIMLVLLAMNLVGITIIIRKLFTYFMTNAQLIYIKKEVQQLEFVWSNQSLEILKTYISLKCAYLRQGLLWIRLIATTSPLLGLLGTVLGLLITFETLAASSQMSPDLFSKGLYQALFTTVGGLIVAIPHTVAYNFFSHWVVSCEEKVLTDLLQERGLHGG